MFHSSRLLIYTKKKYDVIQTKNAQLCVGLLTPYKGKKYQQNI